MSHNEQKNDNRYIHTLNLIFVKKYFKKSCFFLFLEN